jgi:hypothetical protein
MHMKTEVMLECCGGSVSNLQSYLLGTVSIETSLWRAETRPQTSLIRTRNPVMASVEYISDLARGFPIAAR